MLLRDEKSGFASVGWMFSALSLTTSLFVLGSNASDDHGARLLARVRTEDGLVDCIAAALERHGLTDKHPNLRSKQITAQELAALMFERLGRMDNVAWQSLFDVPRNIATPGSDEFTLSALARANFDDGKENLRNVAQQRIDATGAKVVVMGHTHPPDQKRLDGGMYYNPGCWTRYLELQAGQKVTLEDLKDESRYPYQLNAVRVEAGDGGAVKSEMVCFERE